MGKKIGLIFGGVALLLVGYVVYLKVQADKLKSQIKYSLQNFKINKLGLSSISISSNLVIVNPTNVDFAIINYSIDVQVKDTTITTIKGGGSPIVVGANQSTSIPLTVQFDPRKIAQNLLPIFMDVFIVNKNQTADLEMRYVGSLSGRFGGLGFTNLPIDYTYKK